MMIKLEEVRQTLLTDFKTFHDAVHPTVEVNYPNFVVVDIEHQVDPFVSVELQVNPVEQAAMGEQEILVSGVLRVLFYHRVGGGVAGAFSYGDDLNEALGLNLIGPVQYRATSPITVSTLPGWVAEVFALGFDVSVASGC